MASAMAQIAEKGAELGARRVITFVGVGNIAALKGCKRAGFSPYMIRREEWRLSNRHLSSEMLSPGTPYPLDAARAAAA